MIIGVTYSSVYQKEFNFNMKIGDEVAIEDQLLKFDEIKIANQENYQSLKAIFSLTNNNEIIGYIDPGKNYYPVSKMITTEAGIYHALFKDIYITLGSETDNQWFIKVYINPLVSFIWIGVLIMIFASIVAVIKK